MRRPIAVLSLVGFMLLVTLLTPVVAAASVSPSPDPVPTGSTSAHGTPAPDPVPGAVRQTTAPPASISAPVTGAPSSPTLSSASGRRSPEPVSPAPAVSLGPRSVSRHAAHRNRRRPGRGHPPVARPSPNVGLAAVSPHPSAATAPAHPGHMLLFIGGLVLLVLVAISAALRRALRRLQDQLSGGSAA